MRADTRREDILKSADLALVVELVVEAPLDIDIHDASRSTVALSSAASADDHSKQQAARGHTSNSGNLLGDGRG